MLKFRAGTNNELICIEEHDDIRVAFKLSSNVIGRHFALIKSREVQILILPIRILAAERLDEDCRAICGPVIEQIAPVEEFGHMSQECWEKIDLILNHRYYA